MTKYCFFIVLFSSQLMAQETLNWKFLHPVKKTWINAGTFGSVQEKLIETGELPDPFYGENEKKFGWIEDHTWEFTSEFTITDKELQKDYIDIEFPGIDTYAEIFLNDSMIGFAQNAFRPYRFEVKNLLKSGNNKLRVVFYPPVYYHRIAYLKAKYKLPAPNDVNEIGIAPYTRKPQYQFGWDWSLRMNTIGFLKPVSINSYNTTKLIGSNIVITEVKENTADLQFEMNLSNFNKGKIIWKSKLFGDMTFTPSDRIIRQESINDPKLWWPRGQGDQFLYEDEWQILNEKNEVIDSKKVRFGIRQTELVMEADKWGTSYVIKTNGRPVFCKGADYIPQDIFPSRVKDKDLQKMVRTMAESNFNMVRVWGGGYYPDEAFFDACDELGIMVWQDFMFACAMYPGDPDFLQNVKEEIEYQIPRIASHASLTIFNGNNEVDVAWKNWGFQLKYGLFGKEAKEIEDSYDRLFKQLIPKAVNSLSNAPYIHTSPLSNWGQDEYYKHGTQHYWGVWHGKDPITDFATKIGRFNAEYGFQSFPEYSTLLTFSKKTEWDLDSNVMKHHQKSYVGNGMILKHAKILYGKPVDFEEFVYFSQLTQATAVSLAITGHRLDAPRCMGTLYWQLNDCWTAPSWSSIDYFGNWKALQYSVKEDYEDVAVLAKKDAQNVMEYYLVSDQVDTFLCELQYTVYDLSGKKLFKTNAGQLIKGNESERICDKNLKDDFSKKNYVIHFEWKNNKEEEKSRVFSQITCKYVKAEEKDISLKLIKSDSINGIYIIEVKNKKYLRNFWLYSDRLGVQFNSNFRDLIPGKHEFIIQSDTIPELKDFNFKWI